MIVISDRDFGELKFDGIWSGLCEVSIYGKSHEVELVVQTFEGAPINECQRSAFRELNLNKAAVCSAVEDAVFSYYLCRVDEYPACFHADEVDVRAPKVRAVYDMRDRVSLTCIKVMSDFDGGSRQIGFIFDATFDPELGVGVLVTNGCVEAVDTQDMLLG